MTDGSDPSFRLRDDRVIFTEAEGEIVVLDVEQSLYLSMSPTATRLWRRLAAGATAADLCEELVTHFDVTEEIAKRDSDMFLADLDKRGFIEAVPSAS
jgi:hypothetical protein